MNLGKALPEVSSRERAAKRCSMRANSLEGEGADYLRMRGLQSNPFIDPGLFQEHPLQSQGGLVGGDGPRAAEVLQVSPQAAAARVLSSQLEPEESRKA